MQLKMLLKTLAQVSAKIMVFLKISSLQAPACCALVTAMHIDLEARGLPPACLSDVCVIGGGVAGILLAWRLEQSGRDIHLLEAGGPEFEERSQRLCCTKIVGEPHIGAQLHHDGSSLWLADRLQADMNHVRTMS